MEQQDDRSRRRFLKMGSMLGLTAAFIPGTIGKAFANSESRTAQQEGGAQTKADTNAIRPFHANFPEEDLPAVFFIRGKRQINLHKFQRG